MGGSENQVQSCMCVKGFFLIVSLLELHLKPETMDIVSAKESADKEENTAENSIPEKMEENLTSSCQEFIEILGKNVNKYWKIGIHWLTVLRNRLSSPFDEIAIEVLGTTWAIFIPFLIGSIPFFTVLFDYFSRA